MSSRREDSLKKGKKMKEKLNMGIIGAGLIAQKVHLPEYSQREDTVVAVICDTDSERAKKLAEKYGVERVCENWEEAVEMDRIGVVFESCAIPVRKQKTNKANERQLAI